MTLRLIYISEQNEPYLAVISDILKASRDQNVRAGLTGILITSGSIYIQVLEGDEDAVRQTFSRIRKDSRHRSVTLITDGPAQDLAFPEWAMAYVDIGSEDFLDVSQVSPDDAETCIAALTAAPSMDVMRLLAHAVERVTTGLRQHRASANATQPSLSSGAKIGGVVAFAARTGQDLMAVG